MKTKQILTLQLLAAFFWALAGIAQATATDITKLPLGDGKISTSPKAGYIYVCNSASGGGGGAQTDGPWIHGSTWSLKDKIAVQGAVNWPNAQFSSATSTGSRTLSGNDLPVGSATGIFPIGQTDPAYQYDKNPNSIQAQTINFNLPATPNIAAAPSCLPMGQIGVALNGVAIFNGLDAQNRDAVAHEVQDNCQGHPQQEGMYHYHGPSSCLPHASENNALVGYALDGFGIYSGHDSNGNEISTADLDECHGTTSPVMWDGKLVTMYHYVLTQDYPYTLGCFKGTAVSAKSTNFMAGQNQNAGSFMGFSGKNLSVGSSGSDVENLQTFLQQQGFLKLPKKTKKGYFGSLTKNALMKFQKARGLKTTGKFDANTQGFVNQPMQGNNNQQQGMAQQQAGLPGMGAGSQGGQGQGMMQGQNNPNMQQGTAPPQQAINACSGKTANASCAFTSPYGDTITGNCQTPTGSSLACVPNK